MSKKSIATDALYEGHDVTANAQTRAVPIYQNTSYVFKDCDEAADIFSLSKPGFLYTRLNNPTNGILEERLAKLESGVAGVATSSGTGATLTTVLTLLKAGDHIVSSNSLYGGTFNLFNHTLPRFGIKTTFVDPSKTENFENAIKDNTRLVFGESLGNPKLDVLDIEAIAKIAHAREIPFVVDNTVPTPALLRPIEYGADIVLHSLTKYINGNGTSMGGIIVDSGNFDWTNGKFPEFTEPSPSYHGLVYSEAFGNAAFAFKARVEGLRDLGTALSPFNGFQILQGLETLDVRIKKHSENSLELAKWLQDRDEVAWVNYPGLESSAYYEDAKKYLPGGQSGIVTFGVKGGFGPAKKVTDNAKLFSLLANFGDSKSLIIHPASTTHQQLSAEEKESAGVGQDLIRLSIGLEDVADLKADLAQAFNALN